MRSAAFQDIYRHNRWNGHGGTRSGPGSSLAATAILRRVLPELVAGVGAERVLDAGAGDSLWMPDLPGYTGVDIVPRAIAVARRRHPTRHYEVMDICKDLLPQTDLVICRDVLQHLSLADGLAALANFRRTGATWLLAGTFDDGENVDVPTGDYFEPDLRTAPFNLGKPWMVIEDGIWESGVRYPTKYCGVWTLCTS